MDTIFVYGLKDPRNQQVRYIGVTKNLKSRFYGHISNKYPSHKTYWIQSILESGIKPEMFVIEETNELNWQVREQFWIKHYRSLGFDLTNSTDGGRGILNPSLETRTKIRNSRKGRFLGKDNPNFGKHLSEEAKSRIRLSKIGKKLSKEHLAKLSASLSGERHPMYGKKHSSEAIDKMSKSHKGHRLSEATKQRMSAVRKGKRIGTDNPNFGKLHSLETIEKLRAISIQLVKFRQRDKMGRLIKSST